MLLSFHQRKISALVNPVIMEVPVLTKLVATIAPVSKVMAGTSVRQVSIVLSAKSALL